MSRLDNIEITGCFPVDKMNNLRLKLIKMKRITLILLAIVQSCTDPISFDRNDPDQTYLVVDGFITDEPGPHHIRLAQSSAYSSALDEGFESPVTGASVSIIENNIIEYELGETSPGNYITTSFVAGEIGQEYILHIEIGGNLYRSSKQVMPPKVAIDTTYWEEVPFQKLNPQDKILNRYAVQFYADMIMPADEYYTIWGWEGTFQYCSPRHPFICYIPDLPFDEINVLSSDQGFRASVNSYPLSIKELGYKFQMNYAYNLIMYSVQEDVFDIWKLAHRQKQGVGSIFDPVPAQITSNITNVNDNSEIVLGYFAAMSRSEKRVFVRRGELNATFPLTPVPCPEDVPESQLDPRCVICDNFPGSTRIAPEWWED